MSRRVPQPPSGGHPPSTPADVHLLDVRRRRRSDNDLLHGGGGQDKLYGGPGKNRVYQD
ncbi:hypothetical protein ACH429_02680 [Streptomyces pathocidini]|uniref:Uncharacterized protein n=1 Tax=Streptomyces pathocidini TaxID=1650571 RepID=A0ABW7UNS7_9ACTN|nr:hypothetical protein [Streptomyces pathocidini]